jgi:2-polyprenyl-3-methyl-5-hydroxy-6-metoxy-1,4-benzoquinol methylase
VTKDFYEEYRTAAHPPPRSDPLAVKRQRLLWQHIDRYLSGPIRLLDAGAGEGSLMAAALSRGILASGIEVSEAAIDQARQRFPEIDIRQHSVEDLPLASRAHVVRRGSEFRSD